jgi:uncharacterized protein YjbI with pentapeptide repeats/beta-lactamase regulating signal transducer with metallopeptidase domain
MPVVISALEPVARIVVATLFNSLWEAALLALAVALILRVFPNLNATTRYAMWCIALVGSLLLPLATALPQITVQHPSHTVSTVAAPQTAAVKQTAPVKHTPVKHAASHTAPVANVPGQTPRSTFRLPDRLHFALPEYVALALFVIWAVATLAMLVRLGVNLWRLERLKTDALPLPVDYRDRLARWSAAEKGGRDVRLCICDRIEVPVAVGLFDSMILIPQHLLQTLSQEEMDQIMLHELAHLRRADDWTNGLQRVIQSLFFFNPAVLFIAQQLDVEREVACDDWVVHETREVRPYATCLTKMAEVTAWPHRALAAPGVFVTRRGLSVRVERLLRAGRNVRTSIAFGPAGGAVAALVVLFFILQTVAPSFAFTLPQNVERMNPLVAASHAPQPATHTTTHTVTKANAKPAVEERKTEERKTIVYVHTNEKSSSAPVQPQVMPPVKVKLPPTQPKRVVTVAVNPVLPPDFAKNVSALTAKSIQSAMHKASWGSSGSQNVNCVGCDYSGQNLAGHSFRNQRMNGTDFSKANLQNADFSGAVLVGADFSRANLRGASFYHAVLTGCDLSNADLTDVNFDGAEVTGCDVNASALSAHQAGVLLRACHSGCDFTRANLQNQDLHGLNLTGVDLTGADLRGANLSGVNFSGVDFSGARLGGANVDGARFTGCDFSGVDLRNVDMSKATVVGTRFDR